MNSKEKRIIVNCQKGDWSGFGLIYDEYISKLYGFIFLKTMHKETAEDLTSQVFLKVVEKIDTFDSDTNFSAWIFTIARNLVIDFYRSDKKNMNVDDFWDIKSQDDLFESTVMKEGIEKVKNYLEKIDSRKREVILLRVWKGLSFREISQITGRTEGAVKMDFIRSVKKIRGDVLISLFIITFLMKF